MLVLCGVNRAWNSGQSESLDHLRLPPLQFEAIILPFLAMPAPTRDERGDVFDDDLDGPRAGGRRQARETAQEFEIKVGLTASDEE